MIEPGDGGAVHTYDDWHVCVVHFPSHIGIGDRSFTFDHVYPPSVTQTDLYTSTAGGMMKSFLDGYNVTILAYGQTGEYG